MIATHCHMQILLYEGDSGSEGVINCLVPPAAVDEPVTFTVYHFDMEVPLEFISTTPSTTSRTRQVILAVSSFSPSLIS